MSPEILPARFALILMVLAPLACGGGGQADATGPDLSAGATVEERVLFYDQLGEPGAVDNVEKLARAVGRDHVEVQLTVIEALARIGAPEVMPALERAAEDDLSVMKVAVAQASARVQPPAQLDLLHRLARSSSLKVRRAALNSMARVHHVDSVPVFMEALETEDDERIRRAAVQGLGKIGPEAVEAVPLLIELSFDEREMIRWDAVDSLRAVGNEAAANELANHVDSDVPEIRGRACLALAELKVDGAADVILDAMVKERYDVAQAAMARAAAILGETEVAFEVLERILLRGDPWQARLEAVLAYGESGTPDHISLLQEAEHDPMGLVRKSAGEAIEKIRSRHAAAS